MIFNEIYGTYYKAVAKILKAATEHKVDKKELTEIIERNTFGESMLNIEPALREGRWQLIGSDGTTPVENPPTMPLTTLQKRWLKAIFADPRIKLFMDEIPELSDVEPLFTSENVTVFDKYSDGDDFEDETYIQNFRFILKAIKERLPLEIEQKSREGRVKGIIIMPEYLEYSEKDDKFRLVGSGKWYDMTVNLGRIQKCSIHKGSFAPKARENERAAEKSLEFELVDERNALERAMLHFAHFAKEAEKLDEDRYKIKIFYDRADEREMVIRILSFGPMVRVTAPEDFVNLIKERLKKQKSCGK